MEWSAYWFKRVRVDGSWFWAVPDAPDEGRMSDVIGLVLNFRVRPGRYVGRSVKKIGEIARHRTPIISPIWLHVTTAVKMSLKYPLDSGRHHPPTFLTT